MQNVESSVTIKGYQEFVNRVYGLPNERHFSTGDMFSHIQRFAMRGLKGIRQKDYEKAKKNLIISLSWFTSLLNRLHIEAEDEVWKRFPYKCSYCAECPCVCANQKIKQRREITIDDSKRPANLEGFQKMFENIYPSKNRTVEHAGIHLAEELGEFSEAMLAYKAGYKKEDFDNVILEAADLFSHYATVFNSMGLSLSKELSVMFDNNCHVCKKCPCECSFETIINFKI